ncbi:Ger(x)C family spore germination protein [Paenibacillus gansuensis]|uniref:Ger(X)C family spore germination protein n=1 Tax=Paenibacillus gansuensis TaxID=306542 RepID=A0ABW5PE38_9BACL
MRRLLCITLSLFLLTVTLSGCWSRRELNELSMAVAAGIDKVGDEYELTYQVIDPSQMSKAGSSDRSPTILNTEKEKTLYEASRKMTTKAPRVFYPSHLRLLIISERLAKEGIKKPLDIMMRNYGLRPDFFVVISRGQSVRDLMGLVTPFELIPGIEMRRSLKVSEDTWAPTAAVKILELMQVMNDPGQEPVLTGLELLGDIERGKTAENVKQPTTLGEYQYNGLAVMKNDKILGWIGEKDSKAFNYITNKVRTTVGSVSCPNKSKHLWVAEVTKSHSALQPSIKHGSPAMTIQMRIEVNVGSYECEDDITKERTIRELEKEGRKALSDILTHGVHTVQQKYGVDIFGFGSAVHRKYPKQWKVWGKDWNRHFKDMPVEVLCDYHIRRTGQITNTL